MKKILLIAVISLLPALSAYAQGGHSQGHASSNSGRHTGGLSLGHAGGHVEGHPDGHGRGWGRGWIGPLFIGTVILYDVAYPYPYYSDTVQFDVTPAQDYLPDASLSTTQYWYYCPDSNAYYPYVSSCASDWQAVPTVPPQ
jgi:hypothetical protein